MNTQTMWDQRRAERRAKIDAAIYRTGREWIVAEIVIGFVSCATAMTGISGGIVSDALTPSGSAGAWFFFFYGTGSGMLLISALECYCRRTKCTPKALERYAQCRMLLHGLNMLCWMLAFLWLRYTGTFVASVIYQSLPLMVINFWGALEHAKAIWLRPSQARTDSLFVAVVRNLSRG